MLNLTMHAEAISCRRCFPQSTSSEHENTMDGGGVRGGGVDFAQALLFKAKTMIEVDAER
jgi:hypothetical protein